MSRPASPDNVDESKVFWLIDLVKKDGSVNVLARQYIQDKVSQVLLPPCRIVRAGGALTREACTTPEFKFWLQQGIRGVKYGSNTNGDPLIKIPKTRPPPVFYQLLGLEDTVWTTIIKARKVQEVTDKDKPPPEVLLNVHPTQIIGSGNLKVQECRSKDFQDWINGGVQAMEVINPRNSARFMYKIPERNERGLTISEAGARPDHVKEIRRLSKKGKDRYLDVVNQKRRGG